MSKYFNICNFYILLWCLYSLQGTLYMSGSIISQGILAMVLVISLFYTIYANAKFELPPYMKVVNVMLAMFVVYGVALIISSETLIVREGYIGVVSKKDYLKNILTSFLPIYTFFVFAKNGQLTESVIKKWIPVLLIVAILGFIRQQSIALAKAEEILSQQEEFTNNTGYLFLAIIPLLLFIKKPFVQYALLLICGMFIIAAMKRGAILIFALCLPLFMHSTLKALSFRKKMLIFILIAASILALFYYVSYMLDTSEYFNTRL